MHWIAYYDKTTAFIYKIAFCNLRIFVSVLVSGLKNVMELMPKTILLFTLK